ncbi:pyridoxal phosphate-dependent aminotransferase [Pseudomonas sp. S75]|uniref:pyoverdine biosynthesis transaminase PtaA n=1 Tax=unclassified Pseudomonas TaxID=196821 RepID=UPI0019041B80|nr:MULTISPECIES: pyridoxal phosphate-dependent aminotransferase [unclassified Pseudomonas]MBJ9977251.1 pyridoxal phosphate-dependent aminotransferase [Pseudomonas sp. S30]MBK0155508.1 pyridoxal phosphate-dependent aminotransferase [Pseudomonas sp. S75]
MLALSRRSLVGLGLALPALGALRLAHGAPADPGPVQINFNESPWGPSAAARQAMAEGIANCGRYPYKAQYRLIDHFAAQHGLQADQVQVFCGSKLALQHAVMAFTQRGSLVLAEPSYEAPVEAAQARGTAVHAVPLDRQHAHDVDAMLAADAKPGMIYLCNPNNPTGTLTSRHAIERLLSRAPADSVVVVDEAYIHFSDAPSCIELVREHPRLLVLQTFSKLYGMAGARLGLAIGQAPLLRQLEVYDGENVAAAPTLLGGLASLADPQLVPTRKAANARLRDATIAWLGDRGWQCTASQTNCFMIDLRTPAQPVVERLAERGVLVGRVWRSWPNWMRVSVGSEHDMQRLREAFVQVMPG